MIQVRKELLQKAIDLLEGYDAYEFKDGAHLMNELRSAIAQPVQP